jgi:hypothetical protein
MSLANKRLELPAGAGGVRGGSLHRPKRPPQLTRSVTQISCSVRNGKAVTW